MDYRNGYTKHPCFLCLQKSRADDRSAAQNNFLRSASKASETAYLAYPRNVLLAALQWRSEAKCRPGPTIKVPLFPPLKFAYKNLKGKKIVFYSYLKI